MADFSKPPNKKKLKKYFYKYTNGKDEMDKDEFRELCFHLYLAPTKKQIDKLFHTLDKNSDSRLTFDEVDNLIGVEWQPMDERKKEFLDNLKCCRKDEGPLTFPKLKAILSYGQDEALTDEEIEFCLQEMDIDRDGEISDEELCNYIFKVEVMLSRASSRLESRQRSRSRERNRSRSGKKSRSRSRSGHRRKHGSKSRSRSRSGHRRKHGSKSRSRSRDRKRSRSGGRRGNKSRSRSGSRDRHHSGKRHGSSHSRRGSEGETVIVNNVIVTSQVESEPQSEQIESCHDPAPEYVQETAEQNGNTQEVSETTGEQRTDDTTQESNEQHVGNTEQTADEGTQQQPESTGQEVQPSDSQTTQETAPEQTPELSQEQA